MLKLVLLLSVAFLVSCSVLKQYDTTGFTTEGNIVYYNNMPMAELRAVEFAYDDKKLIKELTFSLLNGENNDKIYNLIAFLNTRYKDYEIEVEIPIDQYKFEE